MLVRISLLGLAALTGCATAPDEYVDHCAHTAEAELDEQIACLDDATALAREEVDQDVDEAVRDCGDEEDCTRRRRERGDETRDRLDELRDRAEARMRRAERRRARWARLREALEELGITVEELREALRELREERAEERRERGDDDEERPERERPERERPSDTGETGE